MNQRYPSHAAVIRYGLTHVGIEASDNRPVTISTTASAVTASQASVLKSRRVPSILLGSAVPHRMNQRGTRTTSCGSGIPSARYARTEPASRRSVSCDPDVLSTPAVRRSSSVVWGGSRPLSEARPAVKPSRLRATPRSTSG